MLSQAIQILPPQPDAEEIKSYSEFYGPPKPHFDYQIIAAVQDAIARDNDDKFRFLLQEHPALLNYPVGSERKLPQHVKDLKYPQKNSPLFEAAFYGSEQIMQYLIRSDASRYHEGIHIQEYLASLKKHTEHVKKQINNQALEPCTHSDADYSATTELRQGYRQAASLTRLNNARELCELIITVRGLYQHCHNLNSGGTYALYVIAALNLASDVLDTLSGYGLYCACCLNKSEPNLLVKLQSKINWIENFASGLLEVSFSFEDLQKKIKLECKKTSFTKAQLAILDKAYQILSVNSLATEIDNYSERRLDLYSTVNTVYKIVIYYSDETKLKEKIKALFAARDDVLRGDGFDYCYSLSLANKFCAEVAEIVFPDENASDVLLHKTIAQKGSWIAAFDNSALNLPQSYFRNDKNHLQRYETIVVRAIEALKLGHTELNDIWYSTDGDIADDEEKIHPQLKEKLLLPLPETDLAILSQRSKKVEKLIEYTRAIAKKSVEEGDTILKRFVALSKGLELGSAAREGIEYEMGNPAVDAIYEFSKWWMPPDIDKPDELTEEERIKLEEKIQSIQDMQCSVYRIKSVIDPFTQLRISLRIVVEKILEFINFKNHLNAEFCVTKIHEQLECLLKDEEIKAELRKISKTVNFTLSHAELDQFKAEALADLNETTATFKFKSKFHFFVSLIRGEDSHELIPERVVVGTKSTITMESVNFFLWKYLDSFIRKLSEFNPGVNYYNTVNFNFLQVNMSELMEAFSDKSKLIFDEGESYYPEVMLTALLNFLKMNYREFKSDVCQRIVDYVTEISQSPSKHLLWEIAYQSDIGNSYNLWTVMLVRNYGIPALQNCLIDEESWRVNADFLVTYCQHLTEVEPFSLTEIEKIYSLALLRREWKVIFWCLDYLDYSTVNSENFSEVLSQELFEAAVDGNATALAARLINNDLIKINKKNFLFAVEKKMSKIILLMVNKNTDLNINKELLGLFNWETLSEYPLEKLDKFLLSFVLGKAIESDQFVLASRLLELDATPDLAYVNFEPLNPFDDEVPEALLESSKKQFWSMIVSPTASVNRTLFMMKNQKLWNLFKKYFLEHDSEFTMDEFKQLLLAVYRLKSSDNLLFINNSIYGRLAVISMHAYNQKDLYYDCGIPNISPDALNKAFVYAYKTQNAKFVCLLFNEQTLTPECYDVALLKSNWELTHTVLKNMAINPNFFRNTCMKQLFATAISLKRITPCIVMAAEHVEINNVQLSEMSCFVKPEVYFDILRYANFETNSEGKILDELIFLGVPKPILLFIDNLIANSKTLQTQLALKELIVSLKSYIDSLNVPPSQFAFWVDTARDKIKMAAAIKIIATLISGECEMNTVEHKEIKEGKLAELLATFSTILPAVLKPARQRHGYSK